MKQWGEFLEDYHFENFKAIYSHGLHINADKLNKKKIILSIYTRTSGLGKIGSLRNNKQEKKKKKRMIPQSKQNSATFID